MILKSLKKIILITDYKDAFCTNISTIKGNPSMNIISIKNYFEARGIQLKVIKFSRIDLSENYENVLILYTSSEDSGLRYKSYIEDIILSLELKGAIVLPRYELLRAHHNKVMMEALRYILFPDEAKALGTKIFGCFEEFRELSADNEYPAVIKSSFGAGSHGVAVATNHKALVRIAEALSKSRLPLKESIRELAKRRLVKNWRQRTLNREKFIVQKMIMGLEGDFKVLCFGERYYVLYRRNRKNDFRASGSGDFSFTIPESVNISNLLNHAEIVYKKIDSAVLSLDIGYDGKRFWTIEFQSIYFGTLTAEDSSFYYYKNNNQWFTRHENCNIELVYSEAIYAYLRRYPVASGGLT